MCVCLRACLRVCGGGTNGRGWDGMGGAAGVGGATDLIDAVTRNYTADSNYDGGTSVC